MGNTFGNRIKAFLPYLVIIGIVFLVLPALLLTGSGFITYALLIAVLPLTALLCCAHFSLHKGNDFLLSLAAPVFFLPAMFIYPIASQSVIKAFIYLIAYFLCGYLGLTIGDILAGRNKAAAPAAASASADRRPSQPRPVRRVPVEMMDEDDEPAPAEVRPAQSQRARRVVVEEADHAVQFGSADPYADKSLDTSTTEDDIDAILREIHQRRSGE